ncbi:hypothetical protein D9611_012330 [Ephemerocybe angulata]|uniref:CHAT domain-containing protein n=1 Tax=Ephemerocybe angulata TaxID=980116 RepID=A0A8H5CE00_9AGAR|nr:hypothetical protein D9611_012330 [Tulosesus angulatus]
MATLRVSGSIGPADIEDDHKSLSKAARAFKAQYDRTNDLNDISRAITTLRRAVEITPEGYEYLPFYLNGLGDWLDARCTRAGDLEEDGIEAIQAHRKAVQLTPGGHPAMPYWLNNLGTSLRFRYERTGDINDFAEALRAHQEARTRDLQDLAEDIIAQRRVLDHSPEESPDHPYWINELGVSLRIRFQLDGDPDDLAGAVAAHRKAVQLTAKDHPDMVYWLNNLGDSLQHHFNHTGSVEALTEAIISKQGAVELTPEGHQEMPSRLGDLGRFFELRFQRTGYLHDLAEAIAAQQRAVDLTPERHQEMAIRLTSLGISYHSRFKRTGDLQDLAEAISAGRRAVELTPEDHSRMAYMLNSLGTSLESRFKRTGVLQDLSESISAMRKAVELTREGDRDMFFWLTNIGISLGLRFQYTNDLQDLAEAISTTQKAVALAPEGHADMAVPLHNLGIWFQTRFKRTGSRNDIDEALLVGQRAVALTPEGHGDMPNRLANLGLSFRARFKLTGELGDYTDAISNFKASATYGSGPPRSRLRGATEWARLLQHFDPPSPDILTALDTVICLNALAATLAQTLQTRYTQIQQTSGLPLQAAALAFTLNRVDKALEWLEQGRCHVWGQLTNLRAPLDDLRIHDSQLADSIIEVARRLETAGLSTAIPRSEMSASEKVSLEDQARAHARLAREWDELLARARAFPGLEALLKSGTLPHHLPEAGHVIVVNVDELRCDAIVLSGGCDTPLHIPLPTFSLAMCNQYGGDLKAQLRSYDICDRGGTIMMVPEGERGFRTAVRRGGGSATVIQEILRSLWQDIVKPVLQGLGIYNLGRTPPKVLTRIWWCPTGPLSFLPIHAAGIYGKEDSECIMDYAACSYIPTVTALSDRVRNDRPIDKAVSGLFMTCQPSASGGSHIPGTTVEVQSIHTLAAETGIRAEKVEESAVTPASCLDFMERYSSVHLACHALQGTTDPLKSRFLLYDGSLDLSDILRRNLKNADFAFLSACQTGTGSHELPDEAVHLAAGMLAAGYRRVVATMWSIGDRHAPDVAFDFYKYLLDHRDSSPGERGFDGSKSAHALHHAVQQFRLRLDDNSDRSYLAWIPYVHFGY